MQSKYFPTKDVSAVIDTNVDMVLLSSATLSNPQGDPLAANEPRITPDGFGYITPAGIKAKVRLRYGEVHGDQIWITKGAVLSKGVDDVVKHAGLDTAKLASDEESDETESDDGENESSETTGKKNKKADKKPEKKLVTREVKDQVIKGMAKRFIDFALFGGVLTKPFNTGVRGPVQIGMTFSVNPIYTLQTKITRMAVANEEEAKSKVTTMGDLPVVRFGLYRTEITVSPFEAERMALTWGDLDKFITESRFLWSHSRAGSRGGMAFERLDVFTHAKKGGSVPAEAIFRSVEITMTKEEPTSIRDFDIQVRDLPGVTTFTLTLMDNPQAEAAE